MYGTSSLISAGVTSRRRVDAPRLRGRHPAAQLLHPLLGARDLDAAALRVARPVSTYCRCDSSVSCVISFEWSTGKMKFDACPVEPPGFGSGPLSSRTRSVQPSRARWYARLLPTMPQPITTARARCSGSAHAVFTQRSHAQSTARHRPLEALDVGAHDAPRRGRRRRRGSPRAARGAPRSPRRARARGRGRGTRCAARARSTARASPRGTGCGRSESTWRWIRSSRSIRLRSSCVARRAASSSSSTAVSSRSVVVRAARRASRAASVSSTSRTSDRPAMSPHVDARHEHPASREHVDELLAGEVAERLAHRRPPEAEPPISSRSLTTDARREVERDDPLADRVVRLVGERLLVRKAGPVDVERRRAHRAAAPVSCPHPRAGRTRGSATSLAEPGLHLARVGLDPLLGRLLRVHVLAGDQVRDEVLVVRRPLPALDHADGRRAATSRTST